MNSGYYYPADSPLHRLGAGIKILTLLGLCCGVFAVDRLDLIFLVAATVAGLTVIARIPLMVALQQLRPAVVFLVVIFAVQLLIVDWSVATKVVVRFATLILAASLVTLTTRSSDMLGALERGLKPLSVFGLNTAKVGLAFSLAIRFIPIIANLTAEVREAQRVRGLERSVFAVAVPTIVRTLKMADEIADAIDARCYGSGRKRI